MRRHPVDRPAPYETDASNCIRRHLDFTLPTVKQMLPVYKEAPRIRRGPERNICQATP